MGKSEKVDTIPDKPHASVDKTSVNPTSMCGIQRNVATKVRANTGVAVATVGPAFFLVDFITNGCACEMSGIRQVGATRGSSIKPCANKPTMPSGGPVDLGSVHGLEHIGHFADHHGIAGAIGDFSNFNVFIDRKSATRGHQTATTATGARRAIDDASFCISGTNKAIIGGSSDTGIGYPIDRVSGPAIIGGINPCNPLR